MNVQIIITSKDVEILKQQARQLKREKDISHTQALDEIAQKFKFHLGITLLKSIKA